MPKKGNKLKATKAKQLIKGTSQTLKDQTGFISGVKDGRWEVNFIDGSRIRNITPQGLLSNSSLGINDSVYVVVREGLPLVDASHATPTDYTGTEALLDLTDA